MKKTFGKIIGSLRTDKDLSVYALAQQAGMSDQSIHNLEHDEQLPSLDTARRLARVLGFTLDWLDSQLPDVDLPEPVPGRPRGRPRKEPEAEAKTLPKPSKKRAQKGK